VTKADTDRVLGDPPINEPQVVQQRRRLLNRWSLFLLLVVSAAATVLYVSNVIAVNRLLRDGAVLSKQNDSLRVVNQTLEAETYRLQAADRVLREATTRLGMIAPDRAPKVIGVALDADSR
jgi:cell division protein FtsB